MVELRKNMPNFMEDNLRSSMIVDFLKNGILQHVHKSELIN